MVGLKGRKWNEYEYEYEEDEEEVGVMMMGPRCLVVRLPVIAVTHHGSPLLSTRICLLS